jgi:3-oxoacyl-[acyl-carrier-protein] synthase II
MGSPAVDPDVPTTPVVTAVGLALPGITTGLELLAGAPVGPRTPVDVAARIGRKGLRYKDRASGLALCAAAGALRGGGLLGDLGLSVAGERVGVIVGTETGPIETVCRASATIARETVTGLSPMDLPNASPNVIASSIAIRFGLRGVTMVFTNGPTTGLDALRWAVTLLAAGRIDHVLVVGVETAEAAPVAWLRERGRLAPGAAALDGAVAVVVESAATAADRGAAALGVLGPYARRGNATEALAAVLTDGPEPVPCWRPPDLVLADRPVPAAGTITRDVTAAVGVASGALGVVQCAAALAWLAESDAGPVVAVAGPPGAPPMGGGHASGGARAAVAAGGCAAAMMFLPAAGPGADAGGGPAVSAP